MEIHELICILGPTATGKTSLAVSLAAEMNAEIISADSRQVYKGLDIGTGKDLKEYTQNTISIPYHLIDILEPMKEYNAFHFKRDALEKCLDIQKRQKLPVICGGTGLYIESFLFNYPFSPVAPDKKLRKDLEKLSTEELADLLDKYRLGLSDEDRNNRHRLIRALEVEMSDQKKESAEINYQIKNSYVFGIHFPREIIRSRISERLKKRLEEGMLDEVKLLLKNEIELEWLYKLGLEYRFISSFLSGDLTYDEMFTGLETAIHRFSKRQMTWFRRMEKRGIKIHWIDGRLAMEEKLFLLKECIEK